jgi:hypothetical protein
MPNYRYVKNLTEHIKRIHNANKGREAFQSCNQYSWICVIRVGTGPKERYYV